MKLPFAQLIDEALEAGLSPDDIAESLSESDYQHAYVLGYCDGIARIYDVEKPKLELVRG